MSHRRHRSREKELTPSHDVVISPKDFAEIAEHLILCREELLRLKEGHGRQSREM